MSCAHEHTEPVEVRDLLTPGEVEVVARLCVDCGERLPAGWGCEDCQWVEVQALCQRQPDLVPGRPCAVHARSDW